MRQFSKAIFSFGIITLHYYIPTCRNKIFKYKKNIPLVHLKDISAHVDRGERQHDVEETWMAQPYVAEPARIYPNVGTGEEG